MLCPWRAHRPASTLPYVTPATFATSPFLPSLTVYAKLRALSCTYLPAELRGTSRAARAAERALPPRQMAEELGAGSPADHDTTSVCRNCLRKIKLSTVPADGLELKCDGCSSVLFAGAKIWSCAACDHDICQKCRPLADSLDLRRDTPDPMDDGEEDEGEEDDPEARAAKARRVAAAVDRQQRLLAGTKDWVGDGRRRRRGGDGDEGAGEEGGDDEPVRVRVS